MKKVYKIPTDIQLIKIANILSEELSDIKKDSMSIIFNLDNELFKQVDEDYFFKHNKESEFSSFKPASEVEVIISGIKFKFVKK